MLKYAGFKQEKFQAVATQGITRAYDHEYSLLVVGHKGCGKTSLCKQFGEHTFYPQYNETIGVEFAHGQVTLNPQNIVQCKVWDVSGSLRFLTITETYFKNSHGFLVVYDVTDRSSFEAVKFWLDIIEKGSESSDERRGVVIVGTKIDLESKRLVSTAEGQALADAEGYDFLETSALTGHNVEKAFQIIGEQLVRFGAPKVRAEKYNENLKNGVADEVKLRIEDVQEKDGALPLELLMNVLQVPRPEPYARFVVEKLALVPVPENRVRLKVPPAGMLCTCGATLEEAPVFPKTNMTGVESSMVLKTHLSYIERIFLEVHNAKKAWTKMFGGSLCARACFFAIFLVVGIFLAPFYIFDRVVDFLKKDSVSSSNLNRLELKKAIAPAFLQSLVTAAEAMGTPTPLFDCDSVAAIVECHWQLYGSIEHTDGFVLFGIRLVLFTVLVAVFSTMIDAGGGMEIFGWVLQGVLCVLTLYSVIQEGRVVRVVGPKHLKDAWTIVSLSSSVLVFIGIGILVGEGGPSSSASIVNALSGLLLWFNLLSYLLPYRSTGPLVRMILLIIGDIYSFLVILGVVVIGFATAFYAIAYDASGGYNVCISGSYGSPDLALRQSFSNIFGGYDLSELDNLPSPVALSLLWVAFMIIVSIVLLNILIAIISDSFERLAENNKPAWLLGKAQSTLKRQALMSKKKQALLSDTIQKAPYLYVMLTPQFTQPDGESIRSLDAWNGRVSAIVSRVKVSVDQVQVASNKSQALASELSLKIAGVKSDVADIRSEVNELDLKLDQIVQSLLAKAK